MTNDDTRHDCNAYINMKESLIQAMEDSVKLLEEYLAKGYCVYGKFHCAKLIIPS